MKLALFFVLILMTLKAPAQTPALAPASVPSSGSSLSSERCDFSRYGFTAQTETHMKNICQLAVRQCHIDPTLAECQNLKLAPEKNFLFDSDQIGSPNEIRDVQTELENEIDRLSAHLYSFQRSEFFKNHGHLTEEQKKAYEQDLTALIKFSDNLDDFSISYFEPLIYRANGTCLSAYEQPLTRWLLYSSEDQVNKKFQYATMVSLTLLMLPYEKVKGKIPGVFSFFAKRSRLLYTLLASLPAVATTHGRLQVKPMPDLPACPAERPEFGFELGKKQLEIYTQVDFDQEMNRIAGDVGFQMTAMLSFLGQQKVSPSLLKILSLKGAELFRLAKTTALSLLLASAAEFSIKSALNQLDLKKIVDKFKEAGELATAQKSDEALLAFKSALYHADRHHLGQSELDYLSLKNTVQQFHALAITPDIVDGMDWPVTPLPEARKKVKDELFEDLPGSKEFSMTTSLTLAQHIQSYMCIGLNADPNIQAHLKKNDATLNRHSMGRVAYSFSRTAKKIATQRVLSLNKLISFLDQTERLFPQIHRHSDLLDILNLWKENLLHEKQKVESLLTSDTLNPETLQIIFANVMKREKTESTWPLHSEAFRSHIKTNYKCSDVTPHFF